MNKNPEGVPAMDNRENLEALFAKHGVDDYRWIDPKDIVVAQWVRMKCMFGCGSYGRNASCPPNLPSWKDWSGKIWKMGIDSRRDSCYNVL